MRLWLPFAERKRRKILKEAFKTFRYYAARNEGGRFLGTYTLFNIGLYLLIAERDIQAVKIDALTHPDEWTRKLYARIILITIYEWDADSVSGRAFKNALSTMCSSDELQRQAVGVLRTLRLIQRKVTKNYSLVRNTTIGHRDPNALAQYRAIGDLRVDEVMAVAIEFYAAVEEFVQVVTEIMEAGNTLQSYMRQWIETDDSKTVVKS